MELLSETTEGKKKILRFKHKDRLYEATGPVQMNLDTGKLTGFFNEEPSEDFKVENLSIVDITDMKLPGKPIIQ